MKVSFQALCLVVYAVVRLLPSQPAVLFRPIRRWVARGFLDSVGNDVNIERKAWFWQKGEGVRIGDWSGVGVRASIGPYTVIGNDVMMGPDVVILTQNHCFSDTSRPMRDRGHLAVQPVIVEDDVSEKQWFWVRITTS